MAAQNGQDTTAALLLDAGANPNDEFHRIPLMVAAQEGHIDVVKVLLAHKADPDGKRSAYPEWANYDRPIHVCAEHGHQDIVTLLISAGADVNKVDRFHGTALHRAAEKGHSSIISILISAGADPLIPRSSPHENLPLHLAAAFNKREAALALLTTLPKRYHTDIHACFTALLVFQRMNIPKDVRQLIRCKILEALINKQMKLINSQLSSINIGQYTPCQTALYRKHYHLVQLLHKNYPGSIYLRCKRVKANIGHIWKLQNLGVSTL